MPEDWSAVVGSKGTMLFLVGTTSSEGQYVLGYDLSSPDLLSMVVQDQTLQAFWQSPVHSENDLRHFCLLEHVPQV